LRNKHLVDFLPKIGVFGLKKLIFQFFQLSYHISAYILVENKKFEKNANNRDVTGKKS